MSGVYDRPRGVATRPVVTNQDIELLLAHLFRVPAFRRAAQDKLNGSVLTAPDERAYRLLADVATELGQPDRYPDQEIPYAAAWQRVLEIVSDPHAGYHDDELAYQLLTEPQDASSGQTTGLVYAFYHELPANRFDLPMALELLQRLLQERQVEGRLREILAQAGGRAVVDFSATLSAIATQAQILSTLGSDPFDVAIPTDFSFTPVRRYPTGVDWIDDALGGQAYRDVNGLIGMFGGGKTTSGTQLAVSCARQFRAASLASGEPMRHVVYVSYEEETETLRHRIVACAARVPKMFVEEATSFDEFSTTGALKPYEREWYARNSVTDPAHQLGERERWELAANHINQNLHILDMRKPGRGTGWVDELAGHLQTLVARRGVQPGLVVVDYCNAMVRKWLYSRKMTDDKAMRPMINATPLSLKQQIAEPMDCTVWLLQQFSGEANKRKPGAPLSHADAGEAKGFAENLVFCAAIGAMDPSTRVLALDITKARRRGVQGTRRLLKFDGDFQELKLAEGEFVLEDGRFVDRRVHDQFHGTAPLAGARPTVIRR